MFSKWQSIREEELDEIFYGNCLSHTIHYIASLWLWHPWTAILCAKANFKSAYHHTTLHGDTAAKCIITNDKLAFIGLQLTFGGKLFFERYPACAKVGSTNLSLTSCSNNPWAHPAIQLRSIHQSASSWHTHPNRWHGAHWWFCQRWCNNNCTTHRR